MATSAIELSRLQFGFTAMYHFLFVPLTIGLITLIAIMETAFLRSGRGVWRHNAQFFGKFFLLNFACGIATGYPLRWQLQQNWATYSVYVQEVFQVIFSIEGYIFPSMLALVALFAFGWRLRPLWHWIATCLLAAVLIAQSFSILALNAWMQHPAGVVFAGRQAHVTSLREILLNPLVPAKVLHTVGAAWLLGSIFAMAVSAGYLLGRRHLEAARCTFAAASGLGAVAIVVVVMAGHKSGEELAHYQPMKFAAIEALWRSQEGAPLVLFALPDQSQQINRLEVKVPKVLSWIAFNDLNAPVLGIDTLVADTVQGIRSSLAFPDRRGEQAPQHALTIEEYQRQFGYGALLNGENEHVTEQVIARAAAASVPKVAPLFWGFRVMVACAVVLAILLACSLMVQHRGTLERQRWLLWYAVLSLPLPWIAIEAGWLVCELGRQPWTIVGVLPTAHSGGAVGASAIATNLIAFALAYVALFAVNLCFALRFIRIGPSSSIREFLARPSASGLLVAAPA
jgi:cytochrome bd ubiquinol oxidase subunit I